MMYVLAGIVGLLVGFIGAWFIRANAYHKDVSDVLFRCLENEEEQAQKLGQNSMIDYIVEEKGMDYAIVHYGTIYHILRGIPRKDEKLENVENAVGLFLQAAMQKDIQAYKKEQDKKSRKK